MKRLTFVGALLIAGMLAPFATMAQEFPKKQPIKIVLGVNPGGGTDVLARITAEYLQKRLGQAVVVENKPGAGTAIAVDYVSKAPPDGYTLLLIFNDVAILPAVRANLPYKFDELTFLIRPFVNHPMLFGSPKLAASSAQELVAHMKANPGKVRYGSAGIGGTTHMGIVLFESAVGVKGVHVPYTGISPVYQDMLAGNVEYTEATPPHPEGIKPLASAGTKRNPAYPNVPTLEEAGIKNATWDAWCAFFAPPNLPKPIADRLIAEISAVLKDPEAIAKYQSAAKYTPEVNPLTGEEFKKRVLEEHKNWKAVAAREKIVIQQ